MVCFESSDESLAYIDGTCLVIVSGTSREGFSNKVSGTSQETVLKQS
jgi:hypothetical protein